MDDPRPGPSSPWPRQRPSADASRSFIARWGYETYANDDDDEAPAERRANRISERALHRFAQAVDQASTVEALNAALVRRDADFAMSQRVREGLPWQEPETTVRQPTSGARRGKRPKPTTKETP